jgi:hypothetical protein
VSSLDTAGDVSFWIQCPQLLVAGDVVGVAGVANSTAHLPAGACHLSMFADGANALTTSRDYKVRLVPATPATWCPKITAAADYTEAHDGANSDGNDVITYKPYPGAMITPTALATDAPEPTGITLNPGDARRLTGINAAVPPVVPSGWSDPDTYEITTGPSTTELTWRLNWAATNANLDVSIYPEATLATQPTFISSGFQSLSHEAETDVTAVLPNTKYLVWVAAGLTPAVTMAVPYDISLCGATFTPH